MFDLIVCSQGWSHLYLDRLRFNVPLLSALPLFCLSCIRMDAAILLFLCMVCLLSPLRHCNVMGVLTVWWDRPRAGGRMYMWPLWYLPITM